MEMRSGSRARWLWLGIMLFAAGSVGWYFGTRGHDLDNDALKRRLNALEQQQARADGGLTPDAPLQAVRPRADGLQAAPREQAMVAGRLPNPEAMMRERDRQIDALERKLAADGYDSQWSPKASAATQAAALEPGLEPLAVPQSSDVKCGRSMCRMVFTFDKAGQAADWSDFYPLGLAQTLPAINSHQVTLPDGRVELRMYGFRNGSQAMAAVTGH